MCNTHNSKIKKFTTENYIHSQRVWIISIALVIKGIQIKTT